MTSSWLIEETKKVFLKTGKPGLILIDVYDKLVESGELDKDDYMDPKIILDTENRFYQDAAKEGTLALKQLASSKGNFIYEHILKRECKKQAVANYFILQNNIDNF